MTRSLSIKNILLLTVSVLAILIAALSIREVYIELQSLLKIESLKKSTYLREKFLDIIEDISLERNITYSILKSHNANVSNELLIKLKDNREKVDQGINMILNSLKKYDLKGLPSRIKKTETQYIKHKKLRDVIDNKLENSDYNNKLPRHWFDESTAMIMQTQSIWMNFTRHFTTIDPIVTQRIMFKHFLGMTMDYAGRERALIGGLIIADEAIKPKDQANLLSWHGIVEHGWLVSKKLSERARLTPEITPYLSDAQSHYMNLHDMIYGIFYVPGALHNNSYPISIDLWLELASQTADSIFALKNAALRQTRDYIKVLETKAVNKIVVHIILLFAALGLCGYCFWIIINRVVNPISNIVSVLSDAIEGKEVSLIPSLADRQDEIGKLIKVLKIFQKNTEEIKKTTAELKISDERYRALTDANTEIVWTWALDNTGDFAKLEEWWEKTTGQPKEEIWPSGWLAMVHPDDRERIGKIWGDAAIYAVDFELEYRLKARDGNYRYIYTRAIALKNPTGTLREFVGTLNDITDRKLAEENIQKYTSDLEHSNKELDDFAYIASHDLKEPLRGIHNHSLFLLEDNQRKLDEESISRLNRLIYLSQRLERLINDLLYYSRIGRQELAVQLTDVNDIIHDIEETLDVYKENTKINITIPEALPLISCDKTRIAEVFRNLITNAIKYNDNEIKNIEIGFLKNCRDKNGKPVENVFYVKDNGRGISPEFHDEIFRIFKRLQSSKNKTEEGTGVGLTFIKKIIERHGGRVWIQSAKGIGSTFYFFIGDKN